VTFALPTLLSSAADLEVLRALLDLIETPVFVKDNRHRFVLLNRAACALLGRSYNDVIGRTDFDLLPPEQAEAYVENDKLVLDTGQPLETVELLTDSAGSDRTLLTRKSRLQLPDGEDFVIVCVTDITEFRQADAQIRYSAEHDSLTGLANAAKFRNMLDETLARTTEECQRTAVLLIDLDCFEHLHATQTRSTTENLVVQFARLLSAKTRPDDLAARLGSEEFAVLQTASGQPIAAGTTAAAILDRLGSPFFFDTRPVYVSANIGIAVARPGEDVDALLRRASVARRQAKRDGRNRWRFYDDETDTHQAAEPFLEDDLRNALQEKQFSIVYQPLARVTDLKVVGYEALLRWTHPTLGSIGPSVFIPLAESEGFIVSIGEWVLREACADAARGPNDLALSVNVSPVQFKRTDLVALVDSVIREIGIDPGRIELEVTETSVIGDYERASETIKRLQEIGVKIALDDFGAGYSSLELMRSLPFDKIKIDRSLLRDVGRTQKADAIISAILRLSRTLELSVVAEGVETLEQLAVLRRENCAVFQGFLLGQPVRNPFTSDSGHPPEQERLDG
jgi:diguanylate cyclase (GGDEF)-like protein/PAS domain S-box-containing protein